MDTDATPSEDPSTKASVETPAAPDEDVTGQDVVPTEEAANADVALAAATIAAAAVAVKTAADDLYADEFDDMDADQDLLDLDPVAPTTDDRALHDGTHDSVSFEALMHLTAQVTSLGQADDDAPAFTVARPEDTQPAVSDGNQDDSSQSQNEPQVQAQESEDLVDTEAPVERPSTPLDMDALDAENGGDAGGEDALSEPVATESSAEKAEAETELEAEAEVEPESQAEPAAEAVVSASDRPESRQSEASYGDYDDFEPAADEPPSEGQPVAEDTTGLTVEPEAVSASSGEEAAQQHDAQENVMAAPESQHEPVNEHEGDQAVLATGVDGEVDQETPSVATVPSSETETLANEDVVAVDEQRPESRMTEASYGDDDFDDSPEMAAKEDEVHGDEAIPPTDEASESREHEPSVATASASADLELPRQEEESVAVAPAVAPTDREEEPPLSAAISESDAASDALVETETPELSEVAVASAPTQDDNLEANPEPVPAAGVEAQEQLSTETEMRGEDEPAIEFYSEAVDEAGPPDSTHDREVHLEEQAERETVSQSDLDSAATEAVDVPSASARSISAASDAPHQEPIEDDGETIPEAQYLPEETEEIKAAVDVEAETVTATEMPVEPGPLDRPLAESLTEQAVENSATSRPNSRQSEASYGEEDFDDAPEDDGEAKGSSADHDNVNADGETVAPAKQDEDVTLSDETNAGETDERLSPDESPTGDEDATSAELVQQVAETEDETNVVTQPLASDRETADGGDETPLTELQDQGSGITNEIDSPPGTSSAEQLTLEKETTITKGSDDDCDVLSPSQTEPTSEEPAPVGDATSLAADVDGVAPEMAYAGDDSFEAEDAHENGKPVDEDDGYDGMAASPSTDKHEEEIERPSSQGVDNESPAPADADFTGTDADTKQEDDIKTDSQVALDEENEKEPETKGESMQTELVAAFAPLEDSAEGAQPTDTIGQTQETPMDLTEPEQKANAADDSTAEATSLPNENDVGETAATTQDSGPLEDTHLQPQDDDVVSKPEGDEAYPDPHGEEAFQESHVDEATPETHAEEAILEPQADEVVSESQAEEAIPELQADEAVPESYADEAVHETQAEEAIPEPQADEVVPEAHADDAVPESHTDEVTPETQAEEAIPEPQADEVASETHADEAVPESQAEGAIPELQADEVVPESQADEAVPESQADEAVPETQAEEAIPELQADEAVPESQADEAVPESQAEEATPEPQADEAVPESQADNEATSGLATMVSSGEEKADQANSDVDSSPQTEEHESAEAANTIGTGRESDVTVETALSSTTKMPVDEEQEVMSVGQTSEPPHESPVEAMNDEAPAQETKDQEPLLTAETLEMEAEVATSLSSQHIDGSVHAEEENVSVETAASEGDKEASVDETETSSAAERSARTPEVAAEDDVYADDMANDFESAEVQAPVDAPNDEAVAVAVSDDSSGSPLNEPGDVDQEPSGTRIGSDALLEDRHSALASPELETDVAPETVDDDRPKEDPAPVESVESASEAGEREAPADAMLSALSPESEPGAADELPVVNASSPQEDLEPKEVEMEKVSTEEDVDLTPEKPPTPVTTEETLDTATEAKAEDEVAPPHG
ncbi:hypothetical protein ATCC90586_010753 [Pythium insidiosum]|nr:hypothetical protein ATCC90586_010753 [Pythium insidiosum]